MSGAYVTDSDPHYVYTLWSAEGTCLYVGCTARLGHRMSVHVRDRNWWTDVARIEVAVYPDMASGAAAEESSIRTLQPVHNRVFTDHYTSGRRSWETRRRNQRLRNTA